METGYVPRNKVKQIVVNPRNAQVYVLTTHGQIFVGIPCEKFGDDELKMNWKRIETPLETLNETIN